MIKKTVMVLITLIVIAGLYYLINGESKPENQASGPVVHQDVATLLTGQEFSTIIVYQGSIYAGGLQGLFKIEPDTLSCVEIKNGEQSFQSVRALYLDGEDLWVGHEDGISILRGETIVRRIRKQDGLTDPRIIDLLRTDIDTVYAATFSGVAVIRGQDISMITKNDFLPGDSIKVMMKDSRGGIWFGAYNSRGGGVVIDHGDTKQLIDVQSGLVHNCITTITETPDHQVLVGGGLYTEGGANLLQYAAGQWKIVKTIRKADGLAGDKVRNIYIDHLHQVWFCSEYDGLAIFKESGKILLLTEKDGLSNNEVKKIVQDAQHHYWLATRSGVTMLKPEAVNP